MRIIAGKHRGTRLASLGKGDPAAHLRPTTDRVRESLFNVLNAYVDWDGCRVLDLFAGTGTLGLEALSRGATFCAFVENGRAGQRLIAENITKLRAEEATKLLRNDATRLGPATLDPFDLIFLDPPYGRDFGPRTLTNLLAQGWLSQDALICLEDNTPVPAPDGFDLQDQRSYGSTYISLMTIS